MSLIRFSLVLACLILFGAAPAWADPPARVGRLGYMEGTVTFHAADQGQWAYSAVNYPVTAGLSFWTEPQSRAELQIGSSLLRMDSTTEISVLRLDADATQIQLAQGTISLRVEHMLPGRTIEIETPHGAVSLVQPGTYRIDAGDATTPTTVAALEGTARFIGPNSYLEVETGEQVSANGEPVSYSMSEAQTTPFDDWALQRDKRERESQTIKYVSPEMTGYQDLDEYGTWQPSPQYGQVWVPQNVAADWAPYREGHWAWVAPWGWTWVDDAPWGFAPFHYGRWAQIDNRWAWVPGQPVQQPVYAPALVAFIGGVTLAVNVGWLPLAPNEPYVPSYHASPNYVRNLNYGTVSRTMINNANSNNHTTIINNYANNAAATFVPQAAFTGAQSVRQSAIPAPAGMLQAHAASTGIAALKPTPQARVAQAAAMGNATPAALPGPSATAQAQERREIQHAEPATLATTGKSEIQEKPGQTAAEPHAPTMTAPTPPVQPTLTEHPRVETPAEKVAPVTAARIPAEAEIQHPHIVEHERITAPGPAVATATPHNAVPLRQEQLSRSLATQAKPEAAPPQAAQQAQRNEAAQQAAAQQAQRNEEAKQAAAQQGVHARVAAATPQPSFVKAEVPKPVQSAPLRPTPAGWNRQAEASKPPEPRSAGDKQDKNQDRK